MNRYIDYVSRTDFTSAKEYDKGPDYLYSKDSDDQLNLTKVPGILLLSSSTVHTCKKRGYVKKKFKPLTNDIPEFMIPTNSRQRVDQLVLIDIRLAESADVRKNNKILTGSICDYLGNADSQYSLEIMRRIATGHWRRKFNRSFETSITMTDPMEQDRIEYLDALTISIDPENCEDVDDAISIKKIDNSDSLEVGIHIADPTSYLIEDSDLDLEALKRSESVYIQEALHMYPIELTTDVFSLSSKRNSRAFSIIFNMSSDLKTISNVRILKTMIRVDSNETYDEFERTQTKFEMKNSLYEVGRSIYSMMVSNNTNDIDSVEKYDSKKMIQAFMVYANSIVAEILAESNNRFGRVILRSQPRVDRTVPLVHDVCDKVPQQIVDTYHRLRWKSAILKVWTDDESDAHFGVGLNLYTHFTSPIRRYSDILIHRLLWNVLKNERIFNLTVLNDDAYLQTLFTLNHNKRFYRQMVNFERDWKIYDKMRKVMESDEPINFTGRIVSIGPNYIRVQISSPLSLLNLPKDIADLFNGMVMRIEVMNRKMVDSFRSSAANSDSTSEPLIYEKVGETTVSIQRLDEEPYRLFSTVRVSVVFVKGVRRYMGYLSSL